jgi:hypothetical protein
MLRVWQVMELIVALDEMPLALRNLEVHYWIRCCLAIMLRYQDPESEHHV